MSHGLRRTAVIAALVPLGCAPTLDVLGVYFPGWLVSAVAGVAIGYTVVSLLGRRPATRELAQSGLLFCGVTASAALSVWWIFFGSF